MLKNLQVFCRALLRHLARHFIAPNTAQITKKGVDIYAKSRKNKKRLDKRTKG